MRDLIGALGRRNIVDPRRLKKPLSGPSTFALGHQNESAATTVALRTSVVLPVLCALLGWYLRAIGDSRRLGQSRDLLPCWGRCRWCTVPLRLRLNGYPILPGPLPQLPIRYGHRLWFPPLNSFPF